MSEHRSERRRERRVTVGEAAELLGISKDAVRMRVRRGTLRSEKTEGRMHVWVDADQGADQNAVHPGVPRELVEELRDRVRFLESQLEQANERDRGNRRVVAALTSRMPELEALSEPSEQSEAPETVEAEQELDTERARRRMAESTLHEGMDEERWRREEAERERDDLRRELFALRHRQREFTETAAEEPEGAEPRPGAPGPQEGVQKPWWRRVFGG